MNKNLLFLSLALAACVVTPKNPEYWMEREQNACLPTAIAFRESLRKYDIWAEVFRYSWIDTQTKKLRGHAMVAYLYPPGKNQLWTYDAEGSFRTRAYTNNVTDIAQRAHYTRGWDGKVFSAEFIK